MVFYMHLKRWMSLDPHLLQGKGLYSASKQPFFDTISSLPQTVHASQNQYCLSFAFGEYCGVAAVMVETFG